MRSRNCSGRVRSCVTNIASGAQNGSIPTFRMDSRRAEAAGNGLAERNAEQNLIGLTDLHRIQPACVARMASLGVNIDHIANIRQARRTVEPDPVPMALLAELGGADGITVHLREDRRHIQDRDVELLRHTVRSRLNLEMAATAEMETIALRIRPDMVTLVPERRKR